MKCPECNNEEKLTLVDYHQLFVARDKEHAMHNNFYLENSITVEVKCWECGYEFTKEGSITYKD